MLLIANIKKNRLCFIVIIVLFSCFSYAKENSSKINEGATIKELDQLGIKINVGPGTKIICESPVEDFLLCRFIFDGKEMIAYVGNHPKFPNTNFPSNINVKKISTNNLF